MSIMLPAVDSVWALAAFLFIKRLTAENKWCCIRESNGLGTAMPDERRAFIEAERLVTIFNTASKYDAPIHKLNSDILISEQA